MSSVTIAETQASEWEPLYLSTIAGLSTCIGAAVVFCQPQDHDQSKNTKVVPPKTMAFSLALAGSVMITVSVISILPEVLSDDKHSDIDGEYKMIHIFSWEMFYRIIFFALGCGLYFGLSLLLHVPEPDELLDQVLKHDKSDLSTQSRGFDDDEDVELLSSSMIETETEMATIRDVKSRSSHLSNNNTTTTTGTTVAASRTRTPSPIRQRRKQQTNTKQECHTPGATQNGKIKASSTISFGAWTTGEDLNSNEKKKAWRVAILLFVSLLVHNFPEGLAVAASALESSKLGLTVTIGIMVHNIPEGIAIAIPCLAARPDQPWLSFILASVSGLAEPMGAFVALLFLRDMNQDDHQIMNLENILSFVAGIMIMVALWELFPEAKRHATDTMKYFWYGTISGVIVMVMTELYLP